MKKLDLHHLTDWHLELLQNALACSLNVTLDQWLGDIRDGGLEIWEIPGGIIGLRQEEDRIFVELLAGNRLDAGLILQWLSEVARGRPIEGLVTNPALVRVYKKLGFQVLATHMRYDHGRQ